VQPIALIIINLIKSMYLLGIDLGTSSIKVSVVEAISHKVVAACQYPEVETEILSPQAGWAEQDSLVWWENVKQAIRKVNSTGKYNPLEISAIGIAYQMHGLVALDKTGTPLRNSIIWCDSRAVKIGDKAFADLGEQFSLSHHLNSPGNFTASKLAWVKQNEPEIYEKIDKTMLPGDYIAYKLTGELSTSISALSEGVFWDFQTNTISESIKKYFGFEDFFFPEVKPVFSSHGQILPQLANELGFNNSVQVTYKAGDQPNNALSLNVLEPGEVAATAGTSGVIYGVSDTLVYDYESRINTFAHVNYLPERIRTGILLCINGTGILYSWAKRMFGRGLSYSEMNALALKIKPGSDGLKVLPFGNGAERILKNKTLGAQLDSIDFNRHSEAHIFRAVQEGIAFSFRYGLDIMRENNFRPSVIKAGNANLFLSEVFQENFVGATNVPVELYANDGSVGAALGAGIGSGFYQNSSEAFANTKKIRTVEPRNVELYENLYQEWKEILNKKLT
jgi:xylulokinase